MTELDEAKVEAFSERVLDIVNGGALALMITMGHRSGLFDTLAALPAATSAEIAAKAKLNERYVREWLGALVTGRIIDYDSETGRYTLPREHAALLARTSQLPNLATTCQWIGVLAQVEDDVLGSFEQGGGVPYERFHRFHEVMAEESDQTVVAGLLEEIVPLVPGLQEKLEQGIDGLDVGCGSGRALGRLAERFPKSRFTGYDLCQEAVDAAAAMARQKGLSNLSFELKDVSDISGASFDLVMAFDAIHDQRDPAGVLRGIHQALRVEGTFLMQDIAAASELQGNLDHPVGPFLYTISTMHCMTVSLAQGGAGLGAVWGKELAVKMLGEAGFAETSVKQLPHDFLNNYYISVRG